MGGKKPPTRQVVKQPGLGSQSCEDTTFSGRITEEVEGWEGREKEEIVMPSSVSERLTSSRLDDLFVDFCS